MVDRIQAWLRLRLGKVALALAGLAFSGLAAAAQDADCRPLRVQGLGVDVSKDPRPDSVLIDMLDRGEIVCVSREERGSDRTWVFVAYKISDGNQRRVVGGWTAMRGLEALSEAEAQALRRASTAPPAAPSAPAAPAAPQASSSLPVEEILRFNEPIPFGAFPVNGRTIEVLAQGIPLFPPIEGLDERLWKKSCTGCHKWDRQQLCAQGTSYAKDPRFALRHPHPYGGAYKVALMRWARTGCQ